MLVLLFQLLLCYYYYYYYVQPTHPVPPSFNVATWWHTDKGNCGADGIGLTATVELVGPRGCEAGGFVVKSVVPVWTYEAAAVPAPIVIKFQVRFTVVAVRRRMAPARGAAASSRCLCHPTHPPLC